MKVLVLSPYPSGIMTALKDCEVINVFSSLPEELWPDADWVVSYGYRKRISAKAIERYKGQIVNLHISLLPWNRGCDPNFWSWFDDTPKGVTLHYVNEEFDAGPIIAQHECFPSEYSTLKTSYESLRSSAEQMFKLVWPRLMAGKCETLDTITTGTYHSKVQADRYLSQLPLHWDTPVSLVQEMGKHIRGLNL